MKYWTYIHHYTVDIQVSELQFDNFAKPTRPVATERKSVYAPDIFPPANFHAKASTLRHLIGSSRVLLFISHLKGFKALVKGVFGALYD